MITQYDCEVKTKKWHTWFGRSSKAFSVIMDQLYWVTSAKISTSCKNVLAFYY